MSQTQEYILVVIPTLNEEKAIERVLTDLSQDLPQDMPVFFAVVDGGSTDATRQIVTRLAVTRANLRLLSNAKRIQSAAVNLAVQALGANASVLIRCDAHARYPSGYIKQLIHSLEANDADAVVVPMDSTGHNCVSKAIAWVSDSIVGSGGSAHRGGKASGFVDHGHHAAFRMDSFVRAGGYDESFSHNEDAELDCRQRALGSKIFLDSKIRPLYQTRGTLRKLWLQYFLYGQGRSRTVRKHPESMRLRQLVVPAHVAVLAVSLLLSLRFNWLLTWPLVYFFVLSGSSVALAIKHGSYCALLAAPVGFVMHTAWGLGFLRGWLTVAEERWTPPAARQTHTDSW